MRKVNFKNVGLKMFVYKMGKLHLVSHIDNTDQEVKDLSKVNARMACNGLSEKNGTIVNVDDKHNFFIESRGKYFGVGFISKDIDRINQFLELNSDYGVIDDDGFGFSYVVTLDCVKR